MQNDNYDNFLVELFRQNCEDIRHLEQEQNHFITFFGSFLVAITTYLLTTQNYSSSTQNNNLWSLVFVLLFALLGLFISFQVSSQINHYQKQTVKIKEEFNMPKKFISFTENDHLLLKITRIKYLSISFFTIFVFLCIMALVPKF